MSLKTINLKEAYVSDSDDILNEFYIPILGESIKYDRLSGFFSSQSLALAARGIVGLIKNGGVMRLIVSPKLSIEDFKIIKKTCEDPAIYLEKQMLIEIERLENEFIKDHLFALGWMLANKRLEIKIAIPYDNVGNPLNTMQIENSSIFHLKVGIFEDNEGNVVTYSGSVNETALGWLSGYLGNIEEFKVFKSWNQFDDKRLKSDIIKFNKFWNNTSQSVRVIEIPTAVKEKLISISPKEIEDIHLEKWNKPRKKLFNHQKNAIDAWIKNDYKGILEMATGTGKTITAIACADNIIKDHKENLVVVTCPYQHLVSQWEKEIRSYGLSVDVIIKADGSSKNWKDKLTNYLIDQSIGYIKNIIVITTHRTFSSDDFIDIIANRKGSTLLIADEVHGLGAEKSLKGLNEIYLYRLGLSATPKRYFDDIGTDKLYDYFNGVIFEFTLRDAIYNINPDTNKTYLTPYYYNPLFVSLDQDELDQYIDLTKKIIKSFNNSKEPSDKQKVLELMLFKRSNIIKNCEMKYQTLNHLLGKIEDIDFTIIYSSPQQIDNVMNIVNAYGIPSHRFTMDEGTSPEKRFNGQTERDFILNKFSESYYKILVAMKCLDEGVDVPQAKNAILMASSGNPREYIQRIGRIIRRYKDKKYAIIYDIIVVPSFNNLPKDLKQIEYKIFEKEILRYEDIAKIAINNVYALQQIYEIKNKWLS